MYFQSALYFFVQLWLKIIAFVSNLIFYPVYEILVRFVPDINNYLQLVEDFITDYVVKGTAFVREVLFNVTGYPRALFNFLITFLILKFSLMIVKWGFQFFLNAYYIFRGAK